MLTVCLSNYFKHVVVSEYEHSGIAWTLVWQDGKVFCHTIDSLGNRGNRELASDEVKVSGADILGYKSIMFYQSLCKDSLAMLLAYNTDWDEVTFSTPEVKVFSTRIVDPREWKFEVA